MTLKRMRQVLIIIVVLGFLLRVGLAFGFEATGDTGGWRLGGITGLHDVQVGLGNGTVYDGDCPAVCANWTPFSFHHYIAARWLYENANPLGLADAGYYKIFPVLFDTMAIVGVFFLAMHFQLPTPNKYALIYAFHPVALYIAGYHGQREGIWVSALLFSILMIFKKKYFWAAIMYGLSISIKIPPVLLAPLLFCAIPRIQKRFQFLFISILMFFALNSPEIFMSTKSVVNQVFFYGGDKGWWGIYGLIAKFAEISPENQLFINALGIYGRVYLLVIGVVILLISFTKLPLLEKIVSAFFAIIFFSPAFATQYMLWILPFLLLINKKGVSTFFNYSVASTYFAAASYGIFGLTPLENLLINPQKTHIFYKIPGFIYPNYLAYSIWFISGLFLYRLGRISIQKFYKDINSN